MGFRVLFHARLRERGATMAEYALILSLIAILLITSVAFFGENLDGLFTRIGDTLPF